MKAMLPITYPSTFKMIYTIQFSKNRLVSIIAWLTNNDQIYLKEDTGIKAWNSILQPITDTESIVRFKKTLKSLSGVMKMGCTNH